MDLSVDLFFTHRPPGGGAVAQRARARLDLAAFPGRDSSEPLAALERFAAENSVLPETEDHLAACLDALLRSDAEGAEGLWDGYGGAGRVDEAEVGEIEAMLAAAESAGDEFRAYAAADRDSSAQNSKGRASSSIFDKDGDGELSSDEASFPQSFLAMVAHHDLLCARKAKGRGGTGVGDEEGGEEGGEEGDKDNNNDGDGGVNRRETSLLDEFVAMAHHSARSAHEHAEDTRLRLGVLRHRQAVARAEAAAEVRRAEYRPSVHGMMDEEAAKAAAAHCAALDALDALVEEQAKEVSARAAEWRAEVAALTAAQADDLRAFVRQGVAELLWRQGGKDRDREGGNNLQLKDQMRQAELARGTRIEMLSHPADGSVEDDGAVLGSVLDAAVVSAMISLLGREQSADEEEAVDEGEDEGEGEGGGGGDAKEEEREEEEEEEEEEEGFRTPKQGKRKKGSKTPEPSVVMIRRSEEGEGGEEGEGEVGLGGKGAGEGGVGGKILASSLQTKAEKNPDQRAVASLRSTGAGAAVALTSLSPRASTEMAAVERRAKEAARFLRGAKGTHLVEHFVCFIGAQRRVPVHICVALSEARTTLAASRAFGSMARVKVEETQDAREEEEEEEEEEKEEDKGRDDEKEVNDDDADLALVSDAAISMLEPFAPSVLEMCAYDLESTTEDGQGALATTLDERRDTLCRLCVRTGADGAGPWLGQRRRGGRGMRALLLPFATASNSRFVAVSSGSADYLFPPTDRQVKDAIKTGHELCVKLDGTEAAQAQLKPGDLLVTRHSNLRLAHAAFHAVLSPAARRRHVKEEVTKEEEVEEKEDGAERQEQQRARALADAVTNAVYASARHEVESLVLPLATTLGRYAPVSLTRPSVAGETLPTPRVTTAKALPAPAIRRAEALLQAVKRGLELSVAGEDGRVLGSVTLVLDEIVATLRKGEYDKAASAAVAKAQKAVETTIGKGATGVLTAEQAATALASAHERYRENVATQMCAVVRAVFAAQAYAASKMEE